MKKCFKCNIEKDISEFYKHPKMPDGHLNKCKACSKIDSIANYNKNMENPVFAEKEKKRSRKRGKTRIYKNVLGHNKEYEIKFPEKYKAKIASHRLKKEFDGAEKHHWSYNDEHLKDVIWLSVKDHKKIHRFLIYDQERKMYRRYDTNELLDIRENHAEFINWCIKNKED